jgi:hypothetical protein
MNDAVETSLWDELKGLLRVTAALFGEPASLLGRPPPHEDLAERAFSHAAEAARAFAPDTG